jgi:hypothetical protein
VLDYCKGHSSVQIGFVHKFILYSSDMGENKVE